MDLDGGKKNPSRFEAADECMGNNVSVFALNLFCATIWKMTQFYIKKILRVHDHFSVFCVWIHYYCSLNTMETEELLKADENI